ncbi:hypothetical protein B0H14DRAFT_418976 [Mycena olivaceomarginata]|nr:hypothetical protein B0H14DRAFT_418976 [Mycena olivaceomarginata]
MSLSNANPFFHNCSNFVIHANGSTLVNDNRTQRLRTNSSHYMLEDDVVGLPIIRPETIRLQKELVCRDDHRIHAAQLDGRAVVVKVFHDSQALEKRDASAAQSRYLWHPNFLQLLGCSPRISPLSFLVFHDAIKESTEHKVASVLREELRQCLIVGASLVHGIASGLCYLETNGQRLECLESKDLDLFIGTDDQVKISLNPKEKFNANTITTDVGSNSPLDLLNHLCRRAFTEANQLLYRDEFHESEASTAPVVVNPSTRRMLARPHQPNSSNIDERIDRAGRRELVWKPRKKNTNLSEISQATDRFLFSLRTATTYSIRQYDVPEDVGYWHSCPGYRREEVFLGTTLDNSAIMSHSRPRNAERCTICSQVVRPRKSQTGEGRGKLESSYGICEWLDPLSSHEVQVVI